MAFRSSARCPATRALFATLFAAVSLGLGWGASVHAAAEQKPQEQEAEARKWNGALRKDLTKLVEAWFEARPATRFVEWDETKRAELLERARALGPIPEGRFEDTVELVYDTARKSRKKVDKSDRIEFATPFGPAWAYVANTKEDEGFLLGLHGGGPGVGDASAPRANWKVKDLAAAYPQAVRLDGDAWNTVHGERFELTLFEWAKLDLGVDPDRLYSVGFSMGGTGTWFVAGRHPDWLAGAIPAHGVIMAGPQSQLETPDEVESMQHGLLPNVRNLAMYWYTGTVDRNCMPGTYLFAHARLNELAAADVGGYTLQRFQCHPGIAHEFPAGEPTRGLDWIMSQRRDTFPTTVVWEYATDPFPQRTDADPIGRPVKHWFYWLRCESPTDRMGVRATRVGNTFDIAVTGRPANTRGFSILVAPEMCAPGTEITVTSAGTELYRGTPSSTFEVLLDSFDARVDRRMVFDRRIDL